MEKLMKPAEYAKELGISRQAVYAKIKRGILTAKDVEGKLYIVVDSEQKPSKSQASTSSTPQNRPKQHAAIKTAREYQQLLDAKDETIAVLKGTVEDLKESNHQMSSTLKGEIDLLKAAFSEMKSLYSHRIEQMKLEQNVKSEGVLEAKVKQPKQATVLEEWVSAKKFMKHNDIREEEKKRIEKKLKKAYKRGDQRLSKEDGKLKVDISQPYSDLL
jgi:hypothetical protein